MYQATRKRGGILVTVPQHPFLWSKSDDFSRHVRRYTSSELRDKAERAGFEVVRLTSFVSALLPLLIIWRLKQQFSSREFDPTAEYRISSVMNAALERILDIERAIIRAGPSIPAGGSLLLIARRN